MLFAHLFAAAAGDLATTNPSHYTIIGWLVVGALSLTALASNVLTLARAGRAQKREVSFVDQFVTHEACTTSHKGMEHRITRAEANISELWTTMRREDETTRAEVRKCFQDIERALGRIEGELKGFQGKL